MTIEERVELYNSMLYGEDDAVAWSRFLIENC